MILSALKRTSAFLGDSRHLLLLSGALVIVCFFDLSQQSWGHLIISLAVLAWILPPAWRDLGKDEHRTWRK